jgi:hypothetical protein
VLRLITIPISHYCENDLTFAAVLMPPEYGTRLPQPDALPEPITTAARST